MKVLTGFNTIVTAGLLFTLIACNGEKPLSSSDTQRINREVREMLDNYFRDLNRNGLMAEFRYLDDSPDFFWIPEVYILLPGQLPKKTWAMSLRESSIKTYQPDSELVIENFVYLNPEKSFLGPMNLTISATENENGMELYLCQDGYQSGGDWD